MRRTIKNEAQKALGNPVECFDAENGGSSNDISVAYFYKDGKYIMVSYCPWRETAEGEIDYTMSLWCLRENHAARIQVHALEGLTASPDGLMEVHWQQ